MKRLLCLLFIALFLLSSFSTIVNAENAAYNWYIKRGADGIPTIPSEQSFIEKHECFYIDKNVDDKKVLYLTFDAGYENGNVERILNTLKEKEVTAAFFLLDHIILKNTDIVKRMADEGHLVCNHTKNHKDLSGLGAEEIVDNLTDLERIYEQKCGRTLAKYFRFPEGRYSESALRAVESIGYKSIFWSMAYADWDNAKQPNAEKAIEKLMSLTHNGAVILLHPTSSTNAEIMPIIIDKWREMGYTFGSLDELCR